MCKGSYFGRQAVLVGWLVVGFFQANGNCKEWHIMKQQNRLTLEISETLVDEPMNKKVSLWTPAARSGFGLQTPRPGSYQRRCLKTRWVQEVSCLSFSISLICDFKREGDKIYISLQQTTFYCCSFNKIQLLYLKIFQSFTKIREYQKRPLESFSDTM